MTVLHTSWRSPKTFNNKCYSNRLLDRNPHLACPLLERSDLIYSHSCQGQTLDFESAVFDCGIAASPWCSPTRGTDLSAYQVTWINMVLFAFLDFLCSIGFIPASWHSALSFFQSFASFLWHNNGINPDKKNKTMFNMVLNTWPDNFLFFFGLYATFSILCCDVQWKDGMTPWDNREGSVKTLQKADSVWDKWHFS